MAEIQDRKRCYYSNTQSVKDEVSAPVFLESAGDLLIKDLAKKQTNTKTTLENELKVTQHFEKSFELQPCTKVGLWKAEDFLNEASSSSGTSKFESEGKILDVDELKQKTGLSRHELELALVEKPNSDVSKLYKFAVSNRKRKQVQDDLKSKLLSHPINHLKEIEEEHFGFLKRNEKSKEFRESDFPERTNEAGNEERTVCSNKKKKIRKRKKKAGSVKSSNLNTWNCTSEKDTEIPSTSDLSETKAFTSYRPSLWDVKDMKKFAESKIQDCKPNTLYTIKDGKIVKLSDSEVAEVTADEKNIL